MPRVNSGTQAHAPEGDTLKLAASLAASAARDADKFKLPVPSVGVPVLQCRSALESTYGTEPPGLGMLHWHYGFPGATFRSRAPATLP